jgi:hypothetical protein
MVEPPIPPWLKASQNGSLGEARARAFLLNRFWVLERSVDFQGADLIIQRRITGKNLLDREAPRLGVVQVKFFGTTATSHFVHKEYVLDDKGNPRREFFLLCHSGDESEPRSHIVLASELCENFPATSRADHDGFAISYHHLAASDRFRITNQSLSLDRIERQLELAEFTENRQFLSWALPSAGAEVAAIDADYREPLSNWWGDIPEGFKQLKDVAQRAMVEVEEIFDLLDGVRRSTDPLVAAVKVREIAYNCRGGHGRWSIPLPDGLDSEDFFNTCQRHNVMVNRLRDDGLLDSFIQLREVLRDHVFSFLAARLPLKRTTLHRFTVQYDAETLIVLKMDSQLQELSEYLGFPVETDRWHRIKGAEEFEEHAVEKAVSGQVDYHWLPSRYELRADEGKTLAETCRAADHPFYNDCLDAIFALRYGEPHELVKRFRLR